MAIRTTLPSHMISVMRATGDTKSLQDLTFGQKCLKMLSLGQYNGHIKEKHYQSTGHLLASLVPDKLRGQGHYITSELGTLGKVLVDMSKADIAIVTVGQETVTLTEGQPAYTMVTNAISTLQDNPDFYKHLTTWTQEPHGADERREEACGRILSLLGGQPPSEASRLLASAQLYKDDFEGRYDGLDLSGLGLTTLPPIPWSVSRLDISDNHFTDTPSLFGDQIHLLNEYRPGQLSLVSLSARNCGLSSYHQLAACDARFIDISGAGNTLDTLPDQINSMLLLNKSVSQPEGHHYREQPLRLKANETCRLIGPAHVDDNILLNNVYQHSMGYEEWFEAAHATPEPILTEKWPDVSREDLRRAMRLFRSTDDNKAWQDLTLRQKFLHVVTLGKYNGQISQKHYQAAGSLLRDLAHDPEGGIGHYLTVGDGLTPPIRVDVSRPGIAVVTAGQEEITVDKTSVAYNLIVTAINNVTTQPTFNSTLRHWEAGAPDAEKKGRAIAAERLSAAMTSGTAVLSLSGLGLSAMPPLPAGIRHLDVSDNPFSGPLALPETLDTLVARNCGLSHLEQLSGCRARFMDLSGKKNTLKSVQFIDSTDVLIVNNYVEVNSARLTEEPLSGSDRYIDSKLMQYYATSLFDLQSTCDSNIDVLSWEAWFDSLDKTAEPEYTPPMPVADTLAGVSLPEAQEMPAELSEPSSDAQAHVPHTPSPAADALSTRGDAPADPDPISPEVWSGAETHSVPVTDLLISGISKQAVKNTLNFLRHDDAQDNPVFSQILRDMTISAKKKTEEQLSAGQVFSSMVPDTARGHGHFITSFSQAFPLVRLDMSDPAALIVSCGKERFTLAEGTPKYETIVRALYTTASRPDFHESLMDWKERAENDTERQGREEAVSRILTSLSQYAADRDRVILSLSGLGLTSIPPLPLHIRQLDISHNPLRDASALANIPLEKLDARHCELRYLDLLINSHIAHLDITENPLDIALFRDRTYAISAPRVFEQWPETILIDESRAEQISNMNPSFYRESAYSYTGDIPRNHILLYSDSWATKDTPAWFDTFIAPLPEVPQTRDHLELFRPSERAAGTRFAEIITPLRKETDDLSVYQSAAMAFGDLALISDHYGPRIYQTSYTPPIRITMNNPPDIRAGNDLRIPVPQGSVELLRRGLSTVAEQEPGFLSSLTAWKNDPHAADTEHREEAVNRIMTSMGQYIYHEFKGLDLSGLGLKVLPPLPPQITRLNISDNDFTEDTPSMLALKKLKLELLLARDCCRNEEMIKANLNPAVSPECLHQDDISSLRLDGVLWKDPRVLCHDVSTVRATRKLQKQQADRIIADMMNKNKASGK